MIQDLYQEYLFVIGKLKDIYSLHIDVDHKDIHTFYRNKQPIFKLFYGVFSDETEPSIVVSFHLDLHHAEAIQWFINIYNIHPLVKIRDSFIQDSSGETYLGEDALAIREVYQAQDILEHWLENHDKKEIEEFSKAPVSGPRPDRPKTFDSQTQKGEAIIEFDKTIKPSEDENIH